MELRFTKMHGIGNDYIYFNCFEQNIENLDLESLAITLSDRHFGIGGDGIVLIIPSDKADAKMRMFNIDGSEGKMCGNAIRCVAKYIYENKIVNSKNITIETLSGIKTLDLTVNNDIVESVKVNMGAAVLEPDKIPVKLPLEKIIDYPVNIEGSEYKITCVSMGNPHAVTFLNGIDELILPDLGPKFENHEIFPDRINTEFIEVLGRNNLKMRVWERGSGETLACGTGACASAVAAVLNGYCDMDTDIKVTLLGGELTIKYTENAVYMTGGSTKVFDGVVEIEEN